MALYASEFWLTHSLANTCFKSKENLLNYWEKLACEKLNQKCCRIILSVNRKTSRLAVLGELNRYPLFLKALSQCINYKLSLVGRPKQNSLVTSAIAEMKVMSDRGQDCWLSRVNKIQKLLGITDLPYWKGSGKKLTYILKSKFDRHWLDYVNKTKTGHDQLDHNKLRTYKTFKASFTREPYIDLVRNRNQRAFLSRLRVSSHNLAIERGRYTQPVTPVNARFCVYCSQSTAPLTTTPTTTPPPDSPQKQVDTEIHFLTQCSAFTTERNRVYGDMSTHVPDFNKMSDQQKFVTMLCPTTAQSAKLINRFIKLMFEGRAKTDELINNSN